MIAEHFDRATMAAMEVALDRVCERWTNGGEHMRRKRVAECIIRCAKTGNRCLGAMVEAGERALCARRAARIPRTRRKHLARVPRAEAVAICLLTFLNTTRPTLSADRA
jgi:uncharacterized paraquat-inducible protein A